jgi:uncharacterized protein (DUF488 family)
MKIFTIGYTQKKAKDFFELLIKNKIDILADIRISNSGQLAGFTKKQDLEYFLSLFNISYEYWKDFAPTKELRDSYMKSNNWNIYEKVYKALIEERKSIEKVNFEKLKDKNIVLLCSEPKADNCHRKIAAEIMADKIKAEIVHL